MGSSRGVCIAGYVGVLTLRMLRLSTRSKKMIAETEEFEPSRKVLDVDAAPSAAS